MLSEKTLFRIVHFCAVVTIALVEPISCSGAQIPLCDLGKAVVDQMNLQVRAGNKIDQTTLGNSVIFLKSCPADVIPALDRYESNKEGLRQKWTMELKSDADSGTGGVITPLLDAARSQVSAQRDQNLVSLFRNVFPTVPVTLEPSSKAMTAIYVQQIALTLSQFRRCEGAECYDISDLLLFLLGNHTAAFWSALHSDPISAKIWFSQLPDLSFAGSPKDRLRREQIRTVLLQRVSIPAGPGYEKERAQCISVLRTISFRAWN